MLHEIDSTRSVNKDDCSEVASLELLSTIILILCSVPDFLISTLPSKVSNNSSDDGTYRWLRSQKDVVDQDYEYWCHDNNDAAVIDEFLANC